MFRSAGVLADFIMVKFCVPKWWFFYHLGVMFDFLIRLRYLHDVSTAKWNYVFQLSSMNRITLFFLPLFFTASNQMQNSSEFRFINAMLFKRRNLRQSCKMLWGMKFMCNTKLFPNSLYDCRGKSTVICAPLIYIYICFS